MSTVGSPLCALRPSASMVPGCMLIVCGGRPCAATYARRACRLIRTASAGSLSRIALAAVGRGLDIAPGPLSVAFELLAEPLGLRLIVAAEVGPGLLDSTLRVVDPALDAVTVAAALGH